MNIAEWSIRKSLITWVMTILLVVIGWISFNSLSRLEDPEFTIKEAVITTPYPGASAAEVEIEVTNVIERACQEMGQLLRVESRSSRGVSIVKAVMKDNYDNASLPQVWDELRRKVNDYQVKLPPGAGPSMVNDDFGDVYGVYYAITGEGYTYKEIYEYAKFIQRELLLVQDVKRITFFGVQPEVIYLEMRREKMAELGISPHDIYQALGAKNVVSSAGQMLVGEEYIPINPTGEFRSEQEFGDMLIAGRTEQSESSIFLGDIAEIKRGYKEPPNNFLRYDGKPAIGLAISTVTGGNVVTMGKAVDKRMSELESMRPIGMELHVISHQSRSVTESINGFLVNLVEAIAIVIVVLLVFMGLRSGLIIGFILLVTVMGTFIVMRLYGVTLERISLGALIIALGMLVDNAIVVTDGMRVKMKQGIDALTAAREIVGQVSLPLLGATLVAIAAFASIGTSQDSTGEYCGSLFYVILFSLAMSYLTAVTCTPVLCKNFLMPKPSKASTEKKQKNPYDGKFYQLYRKLLLSCIRFRWITVGIVVGFFLLAILGFGQVKQSFFPNSTRPQFLVDFWFPEGTDIHETARRLEKAEKDLLGRKGITHVSTFVGGGQIRFLLTYSSEYASSSYGQILVGVENYRQISSLAKEVEKDFSILFPQAAVMARFFVLGPSQGGKIQLRLYGPETEPLREMASKVEHLLRDEPNAKGIQNDWRNMVKVLRPNIAEYQAKRAAIERPELARSFEQVFLGTRVGVYREKDELLPIVARSPESERFDFDSLGAIPIWSPVAQTMIPAGQVISNFKMEFENPHIWRRDRMRMVKIHADPKEGLPSELMTVIKPKIEKALHVDVGHILNKTFGPDEDPFDNFDANTLRITDNAKWPIKGMPGYYMAWGGEAEDSARSNAKLAGSIPVFFGLMVLIVLVLFNSIKKTLIIWLTVPLALIGVTAGLLIFRQPFGFMALLGLMSLSGMLIKNAIVLIDQIDLELKAGKAGITAIIDSGVSRLIPVSMAALTTILGMLPLLQDAFFVAMAITIMFGLGFATLLTLIFVPVLYAIFFKMAHERP